MFFIEISVYVNSEQTHIFNFSPVDSKTQSLKVPVYGVYHDSQGAATSFVCSADKADIKVTTEGSNCMIEVDGSTTSSEILLSVGNNVYTFKVWSLTNVRINTPQAIL